MKIRTLIALIIQLMAIQFLLNALLNWSPTAFSSEGQFGFGDVRAVRIALGIMIVSAIFLCAFAKDIAVKMIASDDSINLEALTVVDCFTVVFFVLGIGLIIKSTFGVTYYVVEFFKKAMTGSSDRAFDFWSFLLTILPPIVGFALLLNARSLSVAYARKQSLVGDEATKAQNSEASDEQSK